MKLSSSLSIVFFLFLIPAVYAVSDVHTVHSSKNDSSKKDKIPGKRIQKLSSDTLPSFAIKRPEVENAYRIALTIPGILKEVHCYCGCEPISGRVNRNSLNHQYLLDCYTNSKNKFTDHAVECPLCIVEARDVWGMYTKNKPLDEIKAYILKNYE